MTNPNYLIEVSDLHKSFGELKVLKGVSEHISKGEVVSIIGPSGGGKSTFLRCLNLLEIPDSGKILFEGEDITAKGVNIDLHRQKMGMVFQHFNVFPHMTVGENITMAPVLLGKKKQNEAVEMAKDYAPFVRKIEVEVENLEMVKEAVEAGADIIMLDNMSTEEMQEAIKIIDGRAETECSGNVTKENIGRLTALGVDYISSGALTHSAPILDISMKNLHAVE